MNMLIRMSIQTDTILKKPVATFLFWVTENSRHNTNAHKRLESTMPVHTESAELLARTSLFSTSIGRRSLQGSRSDGPLPAPIMEMDFMNFVLRLYRVNKKSVNAPTLQAEVTTKSIDFLLHNLNKYSTAFKKLS